eukprot:1634767-Pleurochrysis_carterae.AAC.1
MSFALSWSPSALARRSREAEDARPYPTLTYPFLSCPCAALAAAWPDVSAARNWQWEGTRSWGQRQGPG